MLIKQFWLGVTTLLSWIAFIVSVIIIARTRSGITAAGSAINGIKVDTKVGATMPLVLVASVSHVS